MDDFDDSSPLHFPSIPDEDSLYRDMMASLQLLNVDQDSDDTTWCEALQLQQALMSCAGASPYELQQASMSMSTSTSSSSSALPSSSSSPAPCPPPSAASLTEASNSAATRSLSCALCLEKYDRGFFQAASPCDHLFCQFCLGVKSSSEDIACIMDGCNGCLTPTYKSKKCVATPCNLEVLPASSMTDVAKTSAHETT